MKLSRRRAVDFIVNLEHIFTLALCISHLVSLTFVVTPFCQTDFPLWSYPQFFLVESLAEEPVRHEINLVQIPVSSRSWVANFMQC